jgi:hypothetical protein
MLPEGTVITDAIEWQKVEIWFGVKSDFSLQAFDRVNLLLNTTADYINSSFYVDNIKIYEITEFDYIANQYYPTDSVFTPARPGEALTNIDLSSTSSSRFINNNKWNKTKKPCSFFAANPMVLTNDLYPYKQYVSSIYDRFKYHVTQPGLTQPAIQASYENYMSINKVVIKFIKPFSYTTGLVVELINNLNAVAQTITINQSTLDDGVAVIYYSGGTLTQTAWASPPQLTSTGQLQGVLTNIKAIRVYANSNLSINSSFSSADSSKYVTELTSLGIVEISPRLEIDVTPIVMGLNISKELTGQDNNGFPLGTISANNMDLTISNIPVTYNSAPFTIFDNNSTEATFYNLMRQGVKFTCSYTSPLGSFTGSIPAGVFYSNTWGVQDIETVSINGFDSGKYILMATQSPYYSATNAGLVEIVTDLLNAAGFSDYDYDSLINAVDQKTKISYFWCDEQTTVFETLQDLFISHQIGAFFDEYGILNFTSLRTILNRFTLSTFAPDYLITDISSTVNTISYIPNIIPNTFAETVGTKVGKVSITYKTANTQYSDNVSDINGQMGLIANKVDTSRTIWQEETDSGLSCSQISKSIYPQDNYFYFDPSVILDPKRTIASNFGDFFVGSEAISYEGIEYAFFPTNMSDINIKRIITNPSDIDAALLEIKQYLKLLNIDVKSFNYYPTGRAVGVKRGKFNTPIQNHFIFDSQAGTANAISGTISPSGYFNTYSMDGVGTLSSATSGARFSYGNLKMSTSNFSTAAAISPNENSLNYNYYAFSFHCSGLKASNTNVGMFFGHSGTSGSTGWFLTLSRPTGKTTGTQIVLGYGGPNQNAQNVLPLGGVISNQVISYNIYDNAEHRVAIYISSPYVYIYIDGKQITKIKVTSNLAALAPNTTSKFGVFTQLVSGLTGTASATFTELYACNFPVASYLKKSGAFVNFPRYHFQSEVYLNNIVHGIPNIVPHYLWQSKPQIRGVKFYDIKHSLSPALPNTAKLQKVFYGQAQSSNSGTSIILERTNSWDVAYSPLAITPFRTRFIAVNNSNQLVYLKAPNDKVGDQTIVPLQIIANYQVLSQPKMVERVIDKKYINTSVQMDTNWVQGDYDAHRILSDITRLLGGFHRNIDIEVFGNPLIQVGDFVQLKYNLKRIGLSTPVYYFVTSVSQKYSDGLSTSLTLKPMILT